MGASSRKDRGIQKRSEGAVKRRPRMKREAAPLLKARFLEEFQKLGHVTHSAMAAGINRNTAYNWYHNDEEFRTAWAALEERITERIETEAYRRAVDGYEQPVYYLGQEIGSIKKYSDQVLMMLLKARKPKVYNDRLTLQGDEKNPIRIAVHAHQLTDDELATIAAGEAPDNLDIIDDD